MAFDPKKAAKAAVSFYLAKHGYAGFMAAVDGAGIPDYNAMSEPDALALCKKLGYAEMYASAKASADAPRRTPKPKTTAESLAAIADDVYGDDAEAEDGEGFDGDAGDVELNAHPPIKTGASDNIDATEIYGRYNKLDAKTRQARAKLSSPNDA